MLNNGYKLPHFANLVAVWKRSSSECKTKAEEWKNRDEFDEVFQPHSNWVVGVKRLPDCDSDSASVRSQGLVFAEGRDAIQKQRMSSDDVAFFSELADCAQRLPENLTKYPGDFGFLKFDSEGGATIVRSCGGLVPFYYYTSEEEGIVSTRYEWLVKNSGVKIDLDPLTSGLWLSAFSFFPEGRTFLKKVNIVERGSFLRFNGPTEVISKGRYWIPSRASKTYSKRAFRQHAECLRELLYSHLRDNLDRNGDNLLTLSGGTDSASLAFLAKNEGFNFSAWSFLPKDSESLKKQLSYIDPITAQCGISQNFYLLDDGQTRLELAKSAPKIGFPILHPALCDLPKVLKDRPIKVLFGGEFADSICGSQLRFIDWSLGCDSFYLVYLWITGRFPFGWRRLASSIKIKLKYFLKRPLNDLGRYASNALIPEIREEVLFFFSALWQESLCDDPNTALLQFWENADGFMAMNWEGTSPLGIRRSVPFFTREMLELARQCHPRELLGPGTKKLLSEALCRDVPSKFLMRPDKGNWKDKSPKINLPPLNSRLYEFLPVDENRVDGLPGVLILHYSTFLNCLEDDK